MSVLDQFIQFQNFGGDFAFANFVNFSDGWGGNIINIPKEGALLSSVGKAYEFLSKLSIAYPLKIEAKSIDNDILIQTAWNVNKSKLKLLVLNFSDVEKDCEFDLTDLKTKFLNTQKNILVYADKLDNFNSPANKNKIISFEGKSMISTNKLKLKVKPFSANAWIFEKK